MRLGKEGTVRNKDVFDPKKIFAAGQNSVRGLQVAWFGERAFKQEVLASLLIVPLALYLGQTGLERAMLACSWLLVLVVELVNTSIENLVDRVSQERHPLSRRSKDAASGAVLMSMMIAALVWVLVLF